MSKAESIDRVTVTLQANLKNQLKLIGEQQGRNLTSTLEHALKVYVALHDQEGNMKCSIDNILLGHEIKFGTAEEMQSQFETFMGYVKELRISSAEIGSPSLIAVEEKVSDVVEVQHKHQYEPEVEVELDF